MSDKALRQDVIDELDFDPSIDAADIGVAVEDGVVSLSGHVATYGEKVTALEIVSSVKGVHAIADQVEVRPVGSHASADDEIAKRILSMLHWNTSVPEEDIQLVVKRGWVTLKGRVKWRYQADAAVRAVHRLAGVTGVTDAIEIQPSISAPDIRERIKKALLRDAELDAAGIVVDVDDGTVTLEGRVRTWSERRSAERAAWAAPGVRNVVDHLSIQ